MIQTVLSSEQTVNEGEPLNPLLHQALVAGFGKVETTHEGEQRQVIYVPDHSRNSKMTARVIQHGEQYVINCPCCGDTKQHCHINHKFGVYNPQTGSNGWHLFHCYRRNCHKSLENSSILRALLEKSGYRAGGIRQASIVPRLAPESTPQSIPCHLPKGFIPLHELPANHAALEYLWQRGFDPLEISIRYGVGYCETNTEIKPYFERRLAIPIFSGPTKSLPASNTSYPLREYELVGWQARSLDDSTRPKYLTFKGFKKSQCFYGLPEALTIPGPVILCEGVTDAWRIGPGALALFGKTISPDQIRLLNRYFANRPVLILLDRDARTDAHEIRKSLLKSRSSLGMHSQIVIASLPEGYSDPGECPRNILFDSLRLDPNLHEINLLLTLPYDVVDGSRMQFSPAGLDSIGNNVAISYLAAYDPDAISTATSDLVLVGQDYRPYYVVNAKASFLLSLADRTRIYHHALSAQHIELQQDLPIPANFEDLSLAAHLLDENAPFDLPNLTKRFLTVDKSPFTVSNPANPKVSQVINEAALIRRLWNQGQIKEQLEKQDLDFLYRDIELPVLAPLTAMMERGVLFNVSKLQAHREKYPTLIDSLIKHLSSTNRIHPQLDPISCSTGRILCSKPNLQALPVALRDAVIAEEDHVLLSADLSQFELRILAHFSQEPAFLEVYRSGCGDLHRYTAARLFEKPLENITEEERKLGKTVNFSLINGQTANGLADKLNIEITEAQIFIQDFYQRYPQVTSWIDRTLQIAKEEGYVTSLYGRRRHLPDLNSENPFKRARAERQVVSGVIQATGADIFKWMLGRLSKKLPSEFQMILPIHDAILFEIPENHIEEAKTLIREVMQESPPKFKVPLVVNIHAGKSWKE